MYVEWEIQVVFLPIFIQQHDSRDCIWACIIIGEN